MIPMPRQRPMLPRLSPRRRAQTARIEAIADSLSRMPSPGKPLTTRQRQILELLAAGLTADQISAWLYVTEPTVKTTLRTIYRKLGVQNGPAAVNRAWQLGYLPAPGEQAGEAS